MTDLNCQLTCDQRIQISLLDRTKFKSEIEINMNLNVSRPQANV